MRYFFRFVMLMLGVGLATLGLMVWQDQSFTLEGVWLYDNGWRPHALHILVIGIAIIPPSMWELFVLDVRRQQDRG